MNESKTKQSKAISRRTFCRSAITAAVALHYIKPSAKASQNNKVKLYKNLGPGHIGVKANQRQALEYAVKYGFDSITPSPGEFQNKSTSEIRDWLKLMKDKGVRYGASGLPVEFRRDEDRFKADMKRLPRQAAFLRQFGIKRIATWVMPGHNELTYLQKFKLLKNRFREVANVLKDNDIRLGLEFVGPRTTRARFRFPFICTHIGMMELVEEIGTGNSNDRTKYSYCQSRP